jgi:ankyrin repeat protein
MESDKWINNDLDAFFQRLGECKNYKEMKNEFQQLDDPLGLRDDENFTILHKACYLNQNMLVRIILEHTSITKEWINSQSSAGFTGLHFAAYKGNLEVVQLLIKRGADTNEVNEKGLNVLHLAAQNNQIEPIIYFTEKYGMDINKQDKEGSTPLHWSCYTGSETVVSFLLNFPIDINSKDSRGLTPLHLAVISGKQYYLFRKDKDSEETNPIRC